MKLITPADNELDRIEVSNIAIVRKLHYQKWDTIGSMVAGLVYTEL